MWSKLVPVIGNVREDNVGIEAEAADEIAGEVDIIVNSAANTSFDERFFFVFFYAKICHNFHCHLLSDQYGIGLKSSLTKI